MWGGVMDTTRRRLGGWFRRFEGLARFRLPILSWIPTLREDNEIGVSVPGACLTGSSAAAFSCRLKEQG